ncbi:MAG: hypothetical protein FWG40_00500 [Peptococcaceae bacterium]|nr:hypothetical protein [Peptococcaceae bacterium]
MTGLGDWETNLSLDLHWSETMFQTLAFRDRVLKVATADAGATAGEWRPLNLPSRSTPWPEAVAASDRQDLSAIALAVSDYKVPLVERVEWMRQWLLSGAEPEGYRDKANSDRQGLIKALEDGTIKVTHDGGCVAVVESSHRSAMTIGYSLAPVVVAINPTFSFAGNPPVRKITICQYSAGYVDLQAVFAALSNLEPGWGGTDTIGGSPQGAASVLSAEEIIAAVTTATRATVG